MKCVNPGFKCLIAGTLLAASSLPALACYTVYDGANRIMWQGDEAPVDMSRPLHETVPARFPGGQLVFDSDTRCVMLSPGQRLAPTRTASPLLTDQRTARALNVPYTPLQSNIALVQPGEVRMEPGVMTLPAETFAGRGAPATNLMGNRGVDRSTAARPAGR